MAARAGWILALLTAAAPLAAAPPERLANLTTALPASVGPFEASPAELFDPESIYGYIDGGAEVFLAYGMRACLARRWASPTAEIIVDAFLLGSSADAFGAFTHDQDGEPLDIGQGALRRPGWLSLWKNDVFVSITASDDDAPTRAAAETLARAAAAAIAGEGPAPALLARLPLSGRRPSSVRYVHDHVLLETHLPVPPGNPLALGRDTEVVIARYARGNEHAILAVVRYPEQARAVSGAAGARRALAHPTSRARARGFVEILQRGPLVALVVEASNQAFARTLAIEALRASQPREGTP